MTNLKNVLRGYNILAASNNLRIINDIKRDLTTSVISEMDGKASKLIFGQGVKDAEQVTRQYLLMRFESINIFCELLKISSSEDPVPGEFCRFIVTK